MKRIIIILFAVLLLFSAVALAKGGSSGGSVVKPKVVEPAVPTPPDCESFATVKERVKCRLTQGQEKETIPEPCRVLPVAATCVKYYRDSVPCYEKSGIQKDQCFKDVLQFSKKSVKEQAKINAWPVRNYILLLLYDLEERVEDAVDDKKLSADEGAELITDIINIKIKLLEKAPSSEIKADIAALKQQWPSDIK